MVSVIKPQACSNARISIGCLALMWITWSTVAPILGQVLPDSEWAYEESGIRELQKSGYSGAGVRVCMVDTGIDISHTDFTDINLVGFRDFYAGENDAPRDIGIESHGTLMAGLLVANGSYVGSAPDVSLSVAIALGPSGKSTSESMVSQAIDW